MKIVNIKKFNRKGHENYAMSAKPNDFLRSLRLKSNNLLLL